MKNEVEPVDSQDSDKSESTPKKKNIKVSLVETKNLKDVFPAIGEEADKYCEKIGSLRLTSLQLPEIENLKNGSTITFTVKAVMIESEIEQDSKYNEELHTSIVTSDPYTKAKFDIKEVSISGTKKDDKP